MERATPRQVHYVRNIMERYIKHNRLHDLPYEARRFVVPNGRTYTIQLSLLKDLEKSQMDRLLKQLKGV